MTPPRAPVRDDSRLTQTDPGLHSVTLPRASAVDSAYATSVSKVLKGIEESKRQRSVSLGGAGERLPDPAPVPAPPRPLATPPSRASESQAADLPPLVRTNSGNVMNLAGFHSIARRNGSVSAQKQTAYQTRDEDYVSDSEYALGGQRSGSNLQSLRKGKKLQQEKGLKINGMTSSDMTQSDVEDYETGETSVKTLSIASRQEKQPGFDAEKANDFFQNQVAKWRQEFLAMTQKASPLDAPTPQLSEPPKKKTYDRGSMTNPPPSTHSVQIEAKIEPVVKKTSANLEIKMVSCVQCQKRDAQKRTSVGVGTGPLPSVKPTVCKQCAQLAREIEELKVKKIQWNKLCSTEGSEDVNRPEAGMMTDPPVAHSIGLNVNLTPPKPETADSAINTEKEKRNTLEIGLNTEKMACRNVGSGSELPRYDLVDATMNTLKTARASVGLATDRAITGCSFAGGLTSDSGTVTELDLDALLNELAISKQRPVCSAIAVNTDSCVTAEMHTTTDQLIKLFEKGTATEAPVKRHALCGTEVAKCSENSVQTDVPVVEKRATRTTATGTEPRLLRTQYANTDEVRRVSKHTDTGVRVCDAWTSPALGASLLALAPTKALGTDRPTQTDPTRQSAPSSSDECDELWLMPHMPAQPAVASVAVGDGRVDSPPPTSQRVHETFTRHVGVGVCTITDKVCVRCDLDTVEDESQPPGLSFEDSAAYSADANTKSALVLFFIQ